MGRPCKARASVINKVRMGLSFDTKRGSGQAGDLCLYRGHGLEGAKRQGALPGAGLREHFQEGGPRAVHHALARTPGQGSGHRANGIIGRSDKHQVTGRDDLLGRGIGRTTDHARGQALR